LKIPHEKFNICLVTISNTYEDLGYESPFEIVYFQLKATKEDYEKAQEAQKKKAKKPYPSQQRIQANSPVKGNEGVPQGPPKSPKNKNVQDVKKVLFKTRGQR